MKRFNLIIAIAIYLLVPIKTICQDKGKFIHINVDSDVDSVRLDYTMNYFTPEENVPKTSVLLPKAGKYAQLKLNAGILFTYFTVYSNSAGLRTDIFRNGLLEPGDSITICYRKGKLRFVGRGSEKNTILVEVDSAHQSWIRNFQDSVQKQPAKRSKESYARVDSVYISYYPQEFADAIKHKNARINLKLSLLKSYSNRITPTAFRLLETDLVAKEETELLRLLYFFKFNMPNDINYNYKIRVQRELGEIYKANRTPSFLKMADWLSYSSFFYTAYLTQRIKYESKDVSDRYFNIRDNYSGVLRDRLIAWLFLTSFQYPDIMDKLQNARTIVKDGSYHSMLEEFDKVYATGRKAFDFALQDTSGKTVKLVDFKGKVVVMDFWFIGCGPCRVLAKHIKNISQSLIGDTSIVFVSVNVDNNRKDWVKSVKSHIYTSHYTIDLNTGPLGRSHDLLKYYKITAYPKLLIIDRNGLIFSASPKRPEDAKSEEEFTNLLLSIQ